MALPTKPQCISALSGGRYAHCQRQRLSSFGTALQSCPALALRGKSPSLAVVSPYGAPMPHICRLAASIVTSPIAALHTQHHYAEAIPSHGAVFSDHFHFHVSHDERSHIVRVRPGFWRFRLDSNLRIPPIWCGALPTELRNHAPVGCLDPPGNRKGTEGEKWHLTQEAGGFYPANFIQAYFIKRMQWVSVIFVMFYIKSPAHFFRHPQRKHRHSFPQLT